MSLDQLRTVLLFAAGANVALLFLLALPVLFGRRSAFAADERELVVPPEPADIALEVAAAQGDAPAEIATGLPGTAYDRAVRIVSFGFLLAAAAAVGLSGAWPATSPAIYVLLGASALVLLLVHDLLPARVLGAGKYVLEGLIAIGVVTLLVALTGGALSPFVLGYFLITGGAALVVDGRTNLLLAGAISLLYLATVVLLPDTPPLSPAQAATLAVILVAFWLFSYLAAVVARAQRTTRDVAVRLSLHDPLTRLYNRSYFFAVMEREVQRARRTGRPFCLLLLDLDGLKPINDTFGHPMGDRVLRAVAEVIRGRIRGIDTAARYGGDEFVVLLPETDLRGGLTLAQKLRQGVAEMRLATDAWWVRASVSIGVASFPADGSSPQALLDRADRAMFASKRGGPARTGLARPPQATAQGGPQRSPGRAEPDRRGPTPGPGPRQDQVPRRAPVAGTRRAASQVTPSSPRPRHATRPAGAPGYGGTRADSVLAALLSRGVAAVASSGQRGAASGPRGTASGPRAAATAAGTRAASRPAAPAVSASRRPTRGASGGSPREAAPGTGDAITRPRPRRERRFQVVHHDEDAQLARTMRQFIGEPPASAGDGLAGSGSSSGQGDRA